MNNEPVAYVNSMCNDYIDWKADPMSIDGQPLYTHPVELTDEEIEEFKQVASYYGIECSSLTGIQEFIKAILRKAQE